MLGRGIVHGHQHRLIQRELRQDGLCQDFTQRPQRPRRPREDPMVGTGMSRGHALQGPQHAGDRPAASGQDGSHGQRQYAPKRGGGEGHGKTHQKSTGGRWKRQHNGLLSDSFTFVSNKRRQESAYPVNVSTRPQAASKNGRSRAKVRRRRRRALLWPLDRREQFLRRGGLDHIVLGPRSAHPLPHFGLFPHG
jgi:hypothetical protein